MKRNGAPDTTDRNADILEIVPIMRPLVYQHPQLAKGDCASQEGSKGAIREKKRRDTDRRYFGELSRYYQLPLGKKAWGRPLLLKKSKYKRPRQINDILLTCVLLSIEGPGQPPSSNRTSPRANCLDVDRGGIVDMSSRPHHRVCRT